MKLRDKVTFLDLCELHQDVVRHLDDEVVRVFEPYIEHNVPFPTNHKNIVEWHLLSNGGAVGFNENPTGYNLHLSWSEGFKELLRISWFNFTEIRE